jgi:hypothetical protein
MTWPRFGCLTLVAGAVAVCGGPDWAPYGLVAFGIMAVVYLLSLLHRATAPSFDDAA